MIFFLMMYLPLRLGYFMTEPVETDRDLARTALSIAMVTIAAMIPLYKPLDPAIVQRYKQSEQEKSREQQRGAAHQGNTPANPSRIEKK